MRRISVIIPTFRRPEGFLRAAHSVLAQDAPCEIIGLDNSPEQSAHKAFEAFARVAGDRFVYGHERRPGVAHARNAALALASGDLIAWLDDDEEAQPGWLAALVRLHEETGADAVFGPVDARAGEHVNGAYFERLYGRAGPEESGVSERSYGMGNSLTVRASLPGAAPFDPAMNETGGEDDRLFAAMRAAGKRFAWAADARVIEHVDAHRLNTRHALKRAFAYGQGPCETAYAEHHYGDLVRHMMVGAAQAGVYGACAGAAWAVRPESAMDFADLAARGLGKVFWFRTQKFYGASASA